MQELINKINDSQKKSKVVDVKSGDTVRVYQKVKEGSKERLQYFEGIVIKTSRKNSHTASITLRRISSGVGVEKTFMVHSPLVTKIEVLKRSKVNRKYLSYMRQRSGKSARLETTKVDLDEINAAGVEDEAPEDSETNKEHQETPEKAEENEAPVEANKETKEDSPKQEKTEEKPAEKPDDK